jgi:hypothetical protein
VHAVVMMAKLQPLRPPVLAAATSAAACTTAATNVPTAGIVDDNYEKIYYMAN